MDTTETPCPSCGDDLTPCPKCEAPAVELLRTYSLGRHQSMVRLLLAKLSRLRQRVQDAHRHELSAQRAYVESGAAWREATGVLIPAQAQGIREQRDQAIAERDALRVELAAAKKQIEQAAHACPAGQDCDLCLAEQYDLHPCGACTCGNEGTCKWCRMDEARGAMLCGIEPDDLEMNTEKVNP